MKRRGHRTIGTRDLFLCSLSSLSLLVSLAGCEPVLDVAGVYFPGWLVSAVVGVVTAYGIVLGLGRTSKGRPLADSGIFFVSLVVGIALTVWWACFSGF
jgi:amino acid transporter